MNNSLRIDPVGRDGSLVLLVNGELDIVTSPVLDEALLRARATNAPSIVVDLLGVSFIDSTGLHVLIKHVGAEDGRARIRLTKGSPQTQRLFELSGASDYLPFVSEDDGAETVAASNEVKPALEPQTPRPPISRRSRFAGPS